jgi:hypothetical protein
MGIQPLGRFGRNQSHTSQATGMALIRCILGKFLGVDCHCFLPYRLIRIKIKSKDFVRQAYLHFSYIEISNYYLFLRLKFEIFLHTIAIHSNVGITNKSVKSYRP